MSWITTKRALAVFALVGCSWVSPVLADGPHPDEVTDLPGLAKQPTFKQYSGYLDANDGNKLHYWFVESQGNPKNDPVVLWLNGGPGCSSLDGFLSEHGPFLIQPDGKTLLPNPYAWNLVANVVYIEAPVGVGFSYKEGATHYDMNDVLTAQNNYEALRSFFTKFPQFLKNEFFISGESYGGIYVPTLAKEVVDMNSQGNQPRIPLHGFLVGNGLLSYELNDNSVVPYAYYHGLIGDDLWSELKSACGSNFHDPSDARCVAAVQKANEIVEDIGLNFYGLYSDCASNDAFTRGQAALDNLFRGVPKTNRPTPEGNPRSGALGEDVPCIYTKSSDIWLNRPEVQEALHIHPGLRPWSICAGEEDGLTYTRTYNNSLQFFPQLVEEENLRALVYNGDTDMACNFLGDQWGVEKLGLESQGPRRPWKWNGQVAGFVQQFGNVDLLTVKGAGHMVPQKGLGKPAEALHMFLSFLQQTPY